LTILSLLLSIALVLMSLSSWAFDFATPHQRQDVFTVLSRDGPSDV